MPGDSRPTVDGKVRDPVAVVICSYRTIPGNDPDNHPWLGEYRPRRPNTPLPRRHPVGRDDVAAVPQVPQFRSSLVVSMQACPHFVRPLLQVDVQRPRSHTSVAAQALLHAPQFFGSVFGLLQVPLQLSSSCRHAEDGGVTVGPVSLLPALSGLAASALASLVLGGPLAVVSPPHPDAVAVAIVRAANASNPARRKSPMS